MTTTHTAEQNGVALATRPEAPSAQVWGLGLSVDEVLRCGQILAKSGYFKDAMDTAKAAAKIMAGQELGIGPMQSLTQIHVIEGKPTLSAALVGAQIKRSNRYDYRLIEWNDKLCAIEFIERGKKVGVSSFTLEDAQRAKLAGNNWQKYPKAMLFSRALTQGARAYCPDVFGGAVYTPDEIGAEIEINAAGEVLSVNKTAAPETRNVTPAAAEAAEQREPEEPRTASTSTRGELLTDIRAVLNLPSTLNKTQMGEMLYALANGLDNEAGFAKIADVTDEDLREFLRRFHGDEAAPQPKAEQRFGDFPEVEGEIPL